MCGFAGLIGYGRVADSTVDRVSASIEHRGPDGRGEWLTDDVCLIHRRLSIQDIEGGAQPMHSACGRYVVIFNGEIYNFPALKKSLVADGIEFRTNCDTEVLLHLYSRDGDDMVSHLRGMFAFAIWDRQRERLFMARDHIGQKPLFYHHDGRHFVFGSEIKALLATGEVDRALDRHALWHHSSLRFCPADLTLFRSIRKVRPGHTLTFDAGSGQLETRRYWQLDYTNKSSISLEDAVEQGYELVSRVVSEHLLSDVPLGSFLSGGVDSSLVAALAGNASSEKLKTFSIGSLDAEFSELPYAREAADIIGSDHYEFRVKSDLMRLLPDIVWHMEEPGDPHAVGLFQLSELTRSHVTVSLGGDGGDEVFGGYSRFTQASILRMYSALPAWLRRQVMTPIIRRLPESFGYYSLATKARWVNEMSFLGGAARHLHAMTFFRFPDAMRARLFAQDESGDADTLSYIAEHYDSDAADDRIDKMLYTEQMSRMPEHYLLIADRMSMAHGLESRVPLVDKDILEFSAALPSDFKIRNNKLKFVLREIASRHFSEEFLYRTKQGFGFPMGRWFRGELRPFVERVFASAEILDTGLFDREFTNELLAEHMAGTVDHNFRIWMILNLEVWYRMFVLGNERQAVRDWIEDALPEAA